MINSKPTEAFRLFLCPVCRVMITWHIFWEIWHSAFAKADKLNHVKTKCEIQKMNHHLRAAARHNDAVGQWNRRY